MKKFVCFGGGNALPKVVLGELKKHPVQITTITSMTDSGGSTGALRKEFDIHPPGDIRRHILALSEAEDWKKKLWTFRFANDVKFDDGHKGHNFANVFIGGVSHTVGDFEKALEITHDFMKVRGKCLPATLDKIHLFAKLENGQILKGEDDIDVPRNRDGKLKIKEIWLEPKATAYPPAVSAIEEADAIIIGPGDLFSSLLPCFIPIGMREAVQRSKAIKIFIAPAMSKNGETNYFTVEDFAHVVENYIGAKLDYILYNTTVPEKGRIEEYKKKESLVVDLVPSRTGALSKHFIGKDLLVSEGPIEYDSKKVVAIINEIIGPLQ